MKLTLILLLLITSLMAVVGAFLTTSVTSFYIDSFYQQMSSAFGADRREFVADLRSAAAQPAFWLAAPSPPTCPGSSPPTF